MLHWYKTWYFQFENIPQTTRQLLNLSYSLQDCSINFLLCLHQSLRASPLGPLKTPKQVLGRRCRKLRPDTSPKTPIWREASGIEKCEREPCRCDNVNIPSNIIVFPSISPPHHTDPLPRHHPLPPFPPAEPRSRCDTMAPRKYQAPQSGGGCAPEEEGEGGEGTTRGDVQHRVGLRPAAPEGGERQSLAEGVEGE